jgi:hypothetical protein
MLNWRFLNKARSDREALWRGSARGEPHCALECVSAVGVPANALERLHQVLQ